MYVGRWPELESIGSNSCNSIGTEADSSTCHACFQSPDVLLEELAVNCKPPTSEVKTWQPYSTLETAHICVARDQRVGNACQVSKCKVTWSYMFAGFGAG